MIAAACTSYIVIQSEQGGIMSLKLTVEQVDDGDMNR